MMKPPALSEKLKYERQKVFDKMRKEGKDFIRENREKAKRLLEKE